MSAVGVGLPCVIPPGALFMVHGLVLRGWVGNEWFAPLTFASILFVGRLGRFGMRAGSPFPQNVFVRFLTLGDYAVAEQTIRGQDGE